MTGSIVHISGGSSIADEGYMITMVVNFDGTTRLYQWTQAAMFEMGILVGVPDLLGATVNANANYQITDITPLTQQ
ncbi:MAG: hypothetical protein IPN94_02350 [Sphingobacteriales bacterium]|jgi:hypothetical protein|nr:hypothetical protein [Sphingobacteriales bacterium]